MKERKKGRIVCFSLTLPPTPPAVLGPSSKSLAHLRLSSIVFILTLFASSTVPIPQYCWCGSYRCWRTRYLPSLLPKRSCCRYLGADPILPRLLRSESNRNDQQVLLSMQSDTSASRGTLQSSFQSANFGRKFRRRFFH